MASLKTDYQDLELDALLSKVADLATFDRARSYIIDESISFNPLHIRRNIRLTKEAMKYLANFVRPDFSDIKDIDDILILLEKRMTLKANELNNILDHNIQIKRIIKNFKSAFKDDEINDYIISLHYSDHLIDLISRYIDNSGEVKEDATPKLKDLNRQRKNIEASLTDKAQQFLKSHEGSLQEAVIYQRDGRICFLVKNSDKNKYDGYHHGLSASGQAAYIEPKIFVDMNNTLSEIKANIEEEIMQILRSLSFEASKEVTYFKSNLDSIMYLDAIFAKAQFGSLNNGIMADIGDDDLILGRIAHPLIDKDKVIRNSYHIIKPINGIIVTGSNTGGKTVSLKVIALSVLMTYLGIPILADEAKIPLYDGVYDDIDDGQSLVDSLSTFSSRLVTLNRILNKITDRSLVLIDEIASGTDPKEGEALAIAIIDRLIEKGSTFIVTTHFNKVKEYALNDPHILLAAQEFDPERLVPTYRYIENSLGSSNALDIATRYIDDLSLITHAKAILEESRSDEEKMIKAIEEKSHELEKRETSLQAMIDDQKALNDELNDKLKRFEEEKDELYKKVKIKAERYLERQKEKMRKTFAKMLEESKALKESELEKKIEELDEEEVEEETRELKVNDYVMITSTSQVGKIIDIKKDRATIDTNGITIKTALSDLKYYEAPKVTKKVHREKSFKRTASELLVVGMHVEEALDKLQVFLDEAFGSGLKQVKIIHGAGTGALRQAIWQALKKYPYVKAYHYGDSYDGGSNVTIVELK